jgi:hypothetical protein
VVRVAKPRDLGDVQDVQVYLSFVYDGGFLGRYGWVSGAASFSLVFTYFLLSFSSRLLVRAYTWAYLPAFPFLLPLYALSTPSIPILPLSSLHQYDTGLAHQIGINGNIVANRGFVQQFGTITAEDGSVALAAPILSGWNSCINVGQIIAMLAFPP